jgi:hypothetical protein
VPFILAIGAATQQQWFTALSALAASVLVCWLYATVVTVTYRQRLLKSLFLGPFAVILNLWIRHESLWRYEFGEIEWKGRNVCIPVMQVIPRLPSLKQ